MNKPAGLLGFALDNLPLVVLTGRWGNSVHRVMAATTSLLSLTDLGRIYGISAIHCGKTLEHQGWRDRRGRPTQSALDANAAMQTGPHGQGRTVLLNRAVFSQLL